MSHPTKPTSTPPSGPPAQLPLPMFDPTRPPPTIPYGAPSGPFGGRAATPFEMQFMTNYMAQLMAMGIGGGQPLIGPPTLPQPEAVFRTPAPPPPPPVIRIGPTPPGMASGQAPIGIRPPPSIGSSSRDAFCPATATSRSTGRAENQAPNRRYGHPEHRESSRYRSQVFDYRRCAIENQAERNRQSQMKSIDQRKYEKYPAHDDHPSTSGDLGFNRRSAAVGREKQSPSIDRPDRNRPGDQRHVQSPSISHQRDRSPSIELNRPNPRSSSCDRDPNQTSAISQRRDRSSSIDQRYDISSSTSRRRDEVQIDNRRSQSPSCRDRYRSTSASIRGRKDKYDDSDRKLPAAYQKKDRSPIDIKREPGEESDVTSGDGGSDESDIDFLDDQGRVDGNEDRVPMSNLDFDGVGSDVSDTEEEDNPLGATECETGKWTQSAPAKLYFEHDKENPKLMRATERMQKLQEEFDQLVLSANRQKRLGQPQLQPPPAEPLVHRCCHHGKHGHEDSTDSSSSEQSDHDSSSDDEYKNRNRKSKRKKPRKPKREKEKKPGKKSDANRDRKRKKSPSSDSDQSQCSSESEIEHERFKLAMDEMRRKQEHPARLHPELWFNEAGQMNDGPLCRCSWKARQSGIAHAIYPGEKTIPVCDPCGNNLDRLYHYRLVISPFENIKTKIATTINHDGRAFQFEGFSILSHEPLPENLPVCRVIRWNIDYSITFSKEETPELFTIRDLDLIWDYLFVEILELYDLQLRPENSSNSCPMFHVLPRFVRHLEEGGQEILPTNYILKYLINSYRILISDEALPNVGQWPQEYWNKLVEETKDQIVINPSKASLAMNIRNINNVRKIISCKRPTSLRVDSLDRFADVDNRSIVSDQYPIIVHFGVRPAVLTYTGNPDYQKAWKQYVKFRHLLMMKPKLTSEDRTKLAQKEMHLQKLKAKASLKRDVTVEVSSDGFHTTGIYTDVVQHALMLLVAFCHIRFHWSLRSFEEDRIKYKFKNRALLELAFTHPSYRQNYGTNPDHARNALSNCGIRQPEYGSKRMQQILSRKRGINTLIDIMSRMGSKKVKQSQVTNNERLEYLGDAVIEFLSTIHLFFMFPDLQEGGLATYRASLVQNKHLAMLAKKLGMDNFMLYAHGPDLCHEADLKHAMANAFEAVMGAMFLDAGVEIVDRVFGEALFKKEDDPRLNHVWFNLKKHPLQEQEPEGDRHWIEQVAILQKLTEFEKQTGIIFKHIRLLARAFTRKNVGFNFLTLGHNQRLEFLGDTVLQLITSEYLYKHFPEHHEGHLSLLRSCLVNNKTQSVICDDLGMTKYVVHPPAFLKTGPPELRMKDKADLVESFLGALYVDRGLQFCKVFCKVCFYPRLKYFIMSQKWNDPKSQLQQCCLTLRNPEGGEPDIPTYRVISVEGPTNTRMYKVAVYFKGQRLAAGVGHSVQEAEMKAAEEALKRRADLFPHLEKQKYFIENRFRKEFGHSDDGSRWKRQRPENRNEGPTPKRRKRNF